jgi:electron transport complex protein RnfG
MDAPAQPGGTRLALTLALAGLASGLVLVGVYLATLPAIERNRAAALRAAIVRVLPGTEGIEPLPLPEGEAEFTVYAGRNAAGELVGFAIPAAGAGFMDTVRLLYGFDPGRGVIIGMQVLESRETPGLGDKIVHDEEFLENFRALEVDPEIVAVKPGKKTARNQVHTITGATISSEAVVSILNDSVRKWAQRLEERDVVADRR